MRHFCLDILCLLCCDIYLLPVQYKNKNTKHNIHTYNDLVYIVEDKVKFKAREERGAAS